MLINKKKTVISLVLALVVAVTCYYYFAIYNSLNVVSFHADYKGYSTADELYDDAEMVVVGRPVEAFEDRESHVQRYASGAIGDLYTVTPINIERVLKGPSEITNLKVIEPIALFQSLKGKEKISFADYTEMKKDKQYIMFLSKNTFGQYGIINMQAGKFNLDNTDLNDFYSDVSTESNEIKENKIKKEQMFKDIKEKYLK